jgi:putative SOS response-associated peptidase YedK
MCNLYSITAGQAAIRELTRAMVDRTGNLPSMPSVFPDQAAPIVRNGPDGRELALARWGMPSPAFALKNRRTDPGVTNVRNVSSPHWRRWLGVEHRCLVPFTSFSEHEQLPDGSRPPIWFALSEERLILRVGRSLNHRAVTRTALTSQSRRGARRAAGATVDAATSTGGGGEGNTRGEARR